MCEVGVVTGIDTDPVLVKAFQLVGVADLFVIAEIQGREGNVKGVVVVPDEDVRFFGENFADGPVLGGTYQLVVDGKVLEGDGNGAFGGGVQRVEAGEPVRAAEDERTVFQDARGALRVLVPSGAVGFGELDEVAGGAVVFGQAVHGGDPDVALVVFLDGTDVLAGKARHGFFLAGSLVAEDEAVGDGAQPDVSGAVLEDAGGDHDGAAHRGLVVLVHDDLLLHIHCVGVHRYGSLVKADGLQPAGFLHAEFRDIGPGAGGGDIHRPGGAGGFVVAGEGGGETAHPDISLVVLGDGQGAHGIEEALLPELFAVPGAAEDAHLVTEKEPEVSLGVAEHLVGADVAHALVGDEGVGVYRLQLPAFQVIAPQAVHEGDNPQVAGFVRGEGRDGLAPEGAHECPVASEESFGIIGHGVSLVGGAEPQVVPAVLEEGADLCIRDGIGECVV